MAHTIEYQGEATTALDAVLADIAPNGGVGRGGWFIEVTTNDQDERPRTVQGYVHEWLPSSMVSPEARVVIAETVEGEPETRTGALLTIPTTHIEHLTIP